MLQGNPFYAKSGVGLSKLGTAANTNSFSIGAPFYSSVFNSIQDNNIYRNAGVSDLGNIGTTTVGQLGQGASDLAISSGNPYAMAAGVAAKSIFGIADTLDYAFGKERDVNIQGGDYRSDELNAFDLGSEMRSSQDIGKGIVGEAAKKSGVLAPLGAIAGLFAKRRAKKYKEEAESQLADAANRFNTTTSSFFERKGARDMFEQMQIDRERNRMNFGYQSPF